MAEVQFQEITELAYRALAIAKQHAHEIATLEHVLVALLERPDIVECLKSLNINVDDLAETMQQFMNASMIEKTTRDPEQSADFEVLFFRVVGTARFSPKKVATALDVLLHMTQLPHEDSFAVTSLLRAGLTSLAMKKYLSHERGGSNVARVNDMGGEMGVGENDPTNRDEALKLLEKYCVDLNKMALDGKIDPLIGRADEVDIISQILARRTKNNVVMVGEPGTGKTQIAEGLALNITTNNVPETLQGSTIYSLDIGSLVAGTRFRGDFEERVKVVIKALTMVDKSILFIDEIHTIMDAGTGSKGSLDVANLLKPALAKGLLRCIGSTTQEEFRKYFEKDRALLRRFKKVTIDQPSPEVTKSILRGIKSVYEQFHGVEYTAEAIDAAVDLSHKYITNAMLPDKAIDLIDNAGARQRVNPPELKLTVIGVREIEQEISKVTKIPAQEIAEDESASMERLYNDLQSAVFGQDEAVKTLNDAVFVSRAGLKSPNKPAGAYLFVGPTGVGKTEAAKQLSKTLGIPLVKFDMSEYMEKHSVSKFIGAPPGYVGYGEGGAGNGILTNAIDATPSCVLLLDEIEKAHSDIFNILLQVMDEACLTSSGGKSVDFRNVYIIMTSNVGISTFEKNPVGFGTVQVSDVDDKAIKQLFRPEFRNRLDATVRFGRLKPENMLQIVDKFLAELNQLCSARNVELVVEQSAKDWLATEGYDPMMGARPLARVIAEKIKTPLSKIMVTGGLKHGGKAVVCYKNNAITIENEFGTVY